MGEKSTSVIPEGIKKGDFVLVHWLDIATDSGGDPRKSELAPGLTPGFFWEVKTNRSRKCLVCYETHRPGWPDGEEDGSHIFPINVILKVEILKRKKDLKFNG